MQPINRIPSSVVATTMLILAGLTIPRAGYGAIWNITAGAESADLGRQALAFLPNELWIHAGDSVTWTFASDEPHTVSFLTADQLRPTVPHDGDIITPDGSSFDGSAYVNSGELCRNPALCPPAVSNTYTVKFPTVGNFKLSCLAHLYMQGRIHVLAVSALLPYDAAGYEQQATVERADLLSDVSPLPDSRVTALRVIAGVGAVASAGGGFQTAAVMRFFPAIITAHVGDTVEWTNLDAVTNHSVTFGTDPMTLRQPAPIGVVPGVNANLDADGALHANLNSPTDNVHSGALWPLPADRALNGPNPEVDPALNPPDLPQYPLPVGVHDFNQRYRVTFTHAGIYDYHCAYHDNLGMVGRVIVLR
jgi:plastocyanin